MRSSLRLPINVDPYCPQPDWADLIDDASRKIDEHEGEVEIVLHGWVTSSTVSLAMQLVLRAQARGLVCKMIAESRQAMQVLRLLGIDKCVEIVHANYSGVIDRSSSSPGRSKAPWASATA